MSALTVATVTFPCDICGEVTVSVPLDRPTLVRLGCHDVDTFVAVGQTGHDLHDFGAHLMAVPS